MKFSIRAQNPKELVALGLNLAPVPVVHANLYAYCARALCEAVALGVLEAVGDHERSTDEIAAATHLDARALGALLHLLASIGYVQHRDGRFRATVLTRKWLLADSPSSICDAVRFFRLQWRLFDQLPEFLRTGQGAVSHDGALSADDWRLYQRAMFQLARMGAREVAKKTPVPRGATAMLDIGGSHGLYSVELCRRVPTMRAVVLELPDAIEAAAPLLAAINTEQRVRHQPANVLEEDLGEEQYDLILISNLVHHFRSDENQRIAKKAARALRKDGCFIIQDFVRPELGADSDTLSSAQNLFFSLTSAAGVHSLAEQQEWQRQAGLRQTKVIRFVTTPLVQIVATK
jgi:SAM-dependent methyltransferase